MSNIEELRFRGGARLSLLMVPPPLAQLRVTSQWIELRCLGVIRERISKGFGDYLELDEKYLPVGLRLVHHEMGYRGGVFTASGDSVAREIEGMGWRVAG